jgi:hypothetical protein
MELMNNKYLNFEDISCEEVSVKNTTTLNILPDIPEKYFTEDYYHIIKIEDDKLLEAISFELYDSTDYWDILMVLNNMTTMNELPVKYDVVLDRAEKELAGWVKTADLMYSFLDDSDIKDKYDSILKNEIEKNEKYRNFKYISATDLSELMADLNGLEGVIKIPKELIISN